MHLDPAQLFLQLGAIGAVLFVVWKLGSKMIDRQGEAEKERTLAIVKGFEQVTTSIQSHSSADVASHDRLAASHAEVRETVKRFEGKLDAALDWQERTPVESRIPATRTQYGPRPGTKER